MQDLHFADARIARHCWAAKQCYSEAKECSKKSKRENLLDRLVKERSLLLRIYVLMLLHTLSPLVDKAGFGSIAIFNLVIHSDHMPTTIGYFA
jgi:hypothetical protein